MSSRTAFGRPFFRALTGLDVGLRVRIRRTQPQGAIFAGAQNLSVEALTSELAEMVSGLVVYSYAMRGLLEQVTYALQLNVQTRSWSYARRAALDLAGLLAQAQKQHCGAGSRAVRGANCALRIAELCEKEAR
jgi:hypothetical protein